MKVEYITHMGDDLMVVDAARVSFDKKSEWEKSTHPQNECIGNSANILELCPYCLWEQENILSEKDTKLIHYLAKNGHISPFFHPQLQVRVTVPIFIANQLKRHQIGLAVNEVSRRYVDDEPTFYVPNEWRGRPEKSIKQGSSDEVITDICPMVWTEGSQDTYQESSDIKTLYDVHINESRQLYMNMLDSGVAPEMARMILPLSTNTSWIWTGSLAAFARVYKQRKDSHAQKESQIIADQIGEILKKYFPVSFEALTRES